MLSAFPSRPGRGYLRNEERVLRTLNAFALDIISIRNADDLFWYVAQNVVGKLNFVDCVIYRANEEQTQLCQVSAWGEKNPFGRSIVNPLVIPFGEGITGQVAATRKFIIVDDLLKDQNYIPDTLPARSEICVPLICHDRIVGVIDSEHPHVAAFSEADLEILSTVAAMTSAKLDLLAETQRSKHRYQLLLESHAQLSKELDRGKMLEDKLFEAKKLEVTGRMTGVMAHELNNILTIISGNLELLELEGSLASNSQPFCDAKLAVARAAKLIRDMLIVAQKITLEPRDTNLTDLINKVCQSGNFASEGSLTKNLPEDIWRVWIDPKALEYAILSLLNNAREAAVSGQDIDLCAENIIHTAVEGKNLAVGLLPGRYVRLSVTDYGKGISKQQVARIFDPFYTSKGPGKGMGLGLSTALGFIQKSGGTITVRSEVDQGSTFEVYIPAQPIHRLWPEVQ
jgi:signal transduction histidine kinase